VAGQIFLPQDYLPEVYRHVRKAGGLCIADEVQTGYGRIGTHPGKTHRQRPSHQRRGHHP
jgi:4-aminobutyrate aminotransferase-like enzyme